LWQTFDANPVERLVIDVRNNTGGNSEVINPFIASKTARAARMAGVQIVVILGRATFSSGILSAIKLREGQVYFAGEASGGSPNSYGDVQTLVLPNSQLRVSYSTKLFNIPGYPNGPLMPDVAVESYSADFFARHDPFLAAVLAQSGPAAAPRDTAVFNAAAPRLDSAVAPGSLATVYTDMGNVTASDAAALPLPRELGGVQVLVNGTAAALQAVRAGQVNFQVPAATRMGAAAVSIRRGASEMASFRAWIAPAAPGLYAAAAPSGGVIAIYGNGQGATNPPVDDGVAALTAAASVIVPQVYIGAERAEVLFSGLSPSFPGLWQVNVRVPDGITGEMPVFVAASGSASNGVAAKFQE
jgi:uncharacterized protein (TIGR03437 family)